MALKKYKIKNNKFLTIFGLFISIFIVLETIVLLLPITGGIASYPAKIIECGNQPYIVNRFAGAATFTQPGDRLYRGPEVFTRYKDYYCTRADAQNAGNTLVTWSDTCQTSQDPLPAKCKFNENSLSSVFIFYLALILSSAFVAFLVFMQLKSK